MGRSNYGIYPNAFGVKANGVAYHFRKMRDRVCVYSKGLLRSVLRRGTVVVGCHRLTLWDPVHLLCADLILVACSSLLFVDFYFPLIIQPQLFE